MEYNLLLMSETCHGCIIIFTGVLMLRACVELALSAQLHASQQHLQRHLMFAIHTVAPIFEFIRESDIPGSTGTKMQSIFFL